MSRVLIKDREIVVPGEELIVGMDYLPAGAAFREKDKIIANSIGLANVGNRLIRVIPLSGKYVPKAGDTIIGQIADIGLSGWRVDIGWSFEANISMKDGSTDFIERGSDLTQYYNYGDYVVAKILKVVGPKIIDLTMKGPGLRKLNDGKIIKVNSSKVPRIIGKAGSMIHLIKEKTGCNIMVGQNGKVWISGKEPGNVILTIKAIRKIEELSHIQGLTDKIKEFLEGEKK